MADDYTIYHGPDGNHNVFIGQCDKEGHPDGLVRIIFKDGSIGEGIVDQKETKN